MTTPRLSYPSVTSFEERGPQFERSCLRWRSGWLLRSPSFSHMSWVSQSDNRSTSSQKWSEGPFPGPPGEGPTNIVPYTSQIHASCLMGLLWPWKPRQVQSGRLRAQSKWWLHSLLPASLPFPTPPPPPLHLQLAVSSSMVLQGTKDVHMTALGSH